MFISDEASQELQLILDDNDVQGIRLFFAGVG